MPKTPLRRLLKFLHTLGAAGLMGGLAALAVVITLAPGALGGADSLPVKEAMAKIAALIIGPSMVVTVIAGLLAIAINPVFHEAGWVWMKAATGILVLEGCLHVMGPIGEAAKRGAAGGAGPANTASLLAGEGATLWVLLAVSAANIALAIWKPRLPRIPV